MEVTVKLFYYDDEPMREGKNGFEGLTLSQAHELLEAIEYKKDDEMQRSFRGFDSDEIWLSPHGNYAKIKVAQ